MTREVSLEEFFQCKFYDRVEFLEQQIAYINMHEATTSPRIEEVLCLARDPRHKRAYESAVEILSTCESPQVLHAIRRHFTKPDTVGRDSNIAILLASLAVNHNFDFPTRLDTITSFAENPRYVQTSETRKAFSDALDMLQRELFVQAEQIDKALSKIANHCDSARFVSDHMKWFQPGLKEEDDY